ncbi:hypothetical protein Ga0466249_004838 [Sporomusaceae bacterium BoRhaA]|uniref:phage tail tape measure protein n=1 Tax=Pelorhabdus rhamnosifermentans TaxID=2772457 RepID=UPI001C0636FA|nr:phage tail tape measure protein [Pelorhabdus rhamnosifermentans]MBU2703690.1 hypothetical protein [Pelorhabdus rhamnosifermentans]
MADTEVGGLVVKMRADLSDYLQKLNAMEQKSTDTSSKVAKSFDSIGTAMAKVSVVLGGFAATAINNAMNWGTAITKLSRQTGMAAEDTSRFLVVAKSVGVSTDTASMMFSRLAMNINTASKSMIAASSAGKTSDDVFTKLGISTVNLATGAMRPMGDIFADIKTKVASMSDGWQKSAIEMELFGRSGTQLNTMLNMSQEQIQAVTDKAQAMGLILNDQQAPALANLSRQVNAAKGNLTSLGISIGTELMPQVQYLLSEVSNVTQAFVNMDPQTRQNILSVIRIGAEIGITSMAVSKAISVIGGVTEALGVMRLATIAAAGPWVTLAIVIGGAISALDAYANAKYKAEGYDNAAEVRKLESDDGSLTQYQKKTVVNTIMGVPVYNWVNMSDAERERQIAFENRPKPEPTETPTPPTNTFVSDLGGGGSSSDGGSSGSGVAGEKAKTALEENRDSFQKAQEEMQGYLDLNQITAQQYIDYLKEQKKYVTDMAVGDDEQQDKRLMQLDIEKQIQSQQKQMSQDAIQAASQKVQLGKMTEEQYKQVLEDQAKLATSDKDRLALAVQIYQENEKLIDQANKKVDVEANSTKAALDLQQEKSVHSLKMSETSGDDSIQTKFANMKAEYDQAKYYLDKQHDDDDKYLQEKIANSAMDVKKQKEFITQKQQLDAKYELEKEKQEDSYTEKVAAQQKAIINANNSMITALITGTKSGQDVLEDMWKDFVAKVVAKLFQINTETNIFTSLLGGLFGVSNSSGGTSFASNFGITSLSGARASGGDVKAGESYLVGEKGIEVFTPSTDGAIIPNSDITSGALQQNNQSQSILVQPQVTIQQSFQSLDPAENMRLAKTQNASLKNDILNSIRNETVWRNAIKGATT